MVNVELVEDLQRFVRTDRLFGGDLVHLAELLFQIAKHNEQFTSVYNRRPLAEISTVSFWI
jgi:hypothetical protein